MLSPFRKINEIPKGLNNGAIDRGIQAFVLDSRLDPEITDLRGLKQQLTDVFASVLLFKTAGPTFIWMAEDGGEVMGWSICRVSKDVDNSLCYWMTDAWVHPTMRRHPEVRHWYNQMRDDAKALMCKHILVPSSRNTKAYLRYLGKNWHKYIEILKEDI